MVRTTLRFALAGVLLVIALANVAVGIAGTSLMASFGAGGGELLVIALPFLGPLVAALFLIALLVSSQQPFPFRLYRIWLGILLSTSALEWMMFRARHVGPHLMTSVVVLSTLVAVLSLLFMRTYRES